MRYEVELVDLQQQHTAVVREHVARDAIADFLGPAFGEVMAAAARQGLQVSGAPYGRYLPAVDGGWDIEAGFPVDGEIAEEGRVRPATLPGGRTARTLHVGNYADVAAAYDATKSWLVDNGYVEAGDPWECYLDGPEVAQPRTELFVPCHEARPLEPD